MGIPISLLIIFFSIATIMTSKPLAPPTMPIKYAIRQVIIHKKGDSYVVTGLPGEYRIEATGEPAYAYRKLGPDGRTPVGCKWIRAQSVMEDEGRYIATDILLAPEEI